MDVRALDQHLGLPVRALKSSESCRPEICDPQIEFWLHPLHCSGAKPQPLKIQAAEDAVSLAKRTAQGLPWCDDAFRSPCQVVGTSLRFADDSQYRSDDIYLYFSRIASTCCEEADLAVIAAVTSDAGSVEVSAWIILCRPERLSAALKRLSCAGCIRTDFQQVCKLESTIGHGSFSKVCVGYMEGCSRPIAAKSMAETVHADRVQREVAMILACHTHEHIIGYIGIFQDPAPEQRWTLVLERAAGGDLFEYIRQVGRIGEFSAWFILQGLLLALKHLHELDVPILHRDVKAENSLLTVHGEVRLTDFGFACHITDTVEMRRQCGSAGLTAPELLLGRPYDCKVDCFGAGCVLYFMLIGKYPFVGPDVASTLRRNENCQFDFSNQTILERWDRLSPCVRDLIKSLLQRDAESRFAANQALQEPWLLQVPSQDLMAHSYLSLSKPIDVSRRKRRSSTTPAELRGNTLSRLDKIQEETNSLVHFSKQRGSNDIIANGSNPQPENGRAETAERDAEGQTFHRSVTDPLSSPRSPPSPEPKKSVSSKSRSIFRNVVIKRSSTVDSEEVSRRKPLTRRHFLHRQSC